MGAAVRGVASRAQLSLFSNDTAPVIAPHPTARRSAQPSSDGTVVSMDWRGMPAFVNPRECHRKVIVSLATPEDATDFFRLIGQRHTDRTKSIWHPHRPPRDLEAQRWESRSAPPRWPVYIPTKGRSSSRLTSKALTAIGVPHYLVVEPQEVALYREASAGSLATVLPLDLEYKASYELCDDLGLSKSTGPGPARNFAWAHSLAAGHDWHWVMDDNIKAFRRLHDGAKIKVGDGAIFAAMEDFAARYENVAMAGPNYSMFAYEADASTIKPFVPNTRIYSCNLIRNAVPQRWRGRYNEDTILSIDMLKAGWCTVQFNAFLQDKLRTQTLGGGNTAEFYATEGTAPKSEMLARVHPDCVRLVQKYGRPHHKILYERIPASPLRRRHDASPPIDYGLRLATAAER
jgi:hypothetical protein